MNGTAIRAGLGIAFGALLLVGAGCPGSATNTPTPPGQQGAPTAPPATTPGGTVPAQPAQPTPGEGVPAAPAAPADPADGGAAMAPKVITMTAKQFAFEPSEIRVKKGDKVKLMIKSVDVNHGFTLPDFGLNATLEPNKTVTLEFTADKAGSFPFMCSVFCGSGHPGMKGTLIVE